MRSSCVRSNTKAELPPPMALQVFVPDDRLASLSVQHATSSVSTTDDYYAESGGKLRETIIRHDPENVTWKEAREHLQRIDEAETDEEIQSIPERRTFGVANEDDYERISEAALGVANAFVGSSFHAGHELIACPDCGYEASVDQAVFPGGTDHYSDAEKEEEDD